MKKIHLLTVSFCLFVNSLFGKYDDVAMLHKEIDQDFIVMTIHKSGSHLIMKLLGLLSDKPFVSFESAFPKQSLLSDPMLSQENVAAYLYDCFDNKIWVIGHMHFSPYFRAFNPPLQCPILILYRDLRDVCVSAVHHIEKYLPGVFENELGSDANFDEKLMWVITCGFGTQIDYWSNFAAQAREVLSWIGKPNAHFFRFEDLCGPKGGGTKKAQTESIERICSILNIELTESELTHVRENLFGSVEHFHPKKDVFNMTFRKGQIGSWKECFKPEHIEAFKYFLGDELIQLGYETDNEW